MIRIRGRSVPQDLIKRVAVSVSNRIGPARSKAPSLISYLPELGYVASSLRYFPNIESYQIYSRGKKDSVLNLDSDVEIARARYNLASHAGMLFLLSFPTAPAAKDFYSSPVIFKPKGSKGNNLYSKQAGPLVAVLQGDFEPASADKILNSLEYHYSIKWVYDKNNQSEVIWGVPAVILRTVVNSIIFVVLLCIVSIVIGFGFAVLRFKLRGHASKESIHKNEQNEFIRLRLR